MNADDLVLGRVEAVPEAGWRLRADLTPSDTGAPIRLDLANPPPALRAAVVPGALVRCRVDNGRELRRAFWVDSVMLVGVDGELACIWRADKPFEGRSQPSTGSLLPRFAHLAPDGAAQESRDERPRYRHEETEPVWGTVLQMERNDRLTTVGTVVPEGGGRLVRLLLRRAPRGLLASIRPGARVEVLATDHDRDPSVRFACLVRNVELREPSGTFRRVWSANRSLRVNSEIDADLPE